MAEHIDITPTWTQILSSVLAVITESDNPNAVRDMTDELRKMAMLADERNAMVQQGFPPAPARALGDDESALLVEVLRERAEFARAQHGSEPLGAALDSLATMMEGYNG